MQAPRSRFTPVDRCAWCGYDVASLGFPRWCPECGRDTRTRPPVHRWAHLVRIMVAVLLFAAALGAAAIAVLLIARNAPATAAAPPIVVAVAAAITGLAVWRTNRHH